MSKRNSSPAPAKSPIPIEAKSPAKDFILRIQAAMINLILQDGTTVDTLGQDLQSKMEQIGEKLLAIDPSMKQSAMKMMDDPRLLSNPDAIIQEIIEAFTEMTGSPAPAPNPWRAARYDLYQYYGTSPMLLPWNDESWNENEYEGIMGDFVPKQILIDEPTDCICPNLLNGHQKNCYFQAK